MKSSSFYLASFLLISSLSSPFAFGQIASSDTLFGGDHSGGGDISELAPIGSAKVETFLSNARIILISYFNGKKLRLTPDQEHPGLVEVLNKINDQIVANPIKYERTQLCKDKDGTYKDGSIYSDTPGTICISTYSLGKKLNSENFENQSTALVAHEYAHLAGASEEIAVFFQNEVINSQLGRKKGDFNLFLIHSAVFWHILEVLKDAPTYKTLRSENKWLPGGATIIMWLEEDFSNARIGAFNSYPFSLFYSAEQIKEVRSLMDASFDFFHSKKLNEHDYVQGIDKMKAEFSKMNELSRQFQELDLKLRKEDNDLNRQ